VGQGRSSQRVQFPNRDGHILILPPNLATGLSLCSSAHNRYSIPMVGEPPILSFARAHRLLPPFAFKSVLWSIMEQFVLNMTTEE
jgi:hypothetical protein